MKIWKIVVSLGIGTVLYYCSSIRAFLNLTVDVGSIIQWKSRILVVVTVTCATSIFYNAIVCIVLRYFAKRRHSFYFALKWIGMVDILTVSWTNLLVVHFLLNMPSKYSSRAWNNYLEYLLSSYFPLYIICGGLWVCDYFLPGILLALQVFRYYKKRSYDLTSRFKLKMVALVILPLAGLMLITFNLAMTSTKVHYVYCILVYVVPTAMTLTSFLIMKFYLRQANTPEYIIFKYIFNMFFVCHSPLYLLRILTYSGVVSPEMADKYLGFASSLLLLRTFLNLPLLAAVDYHFREGFFDLLRKCLPEKITALILPEKKAIE